MYKRLGSADGAPLVVSIAHNSGEQYFFDATEVELIAESPGFLKLETQYRDDTQKLVKLVRDALSRYRVLMPDTSINLLVQNHIFKFFVTQNMKPAG